MSSRPNITLFKGRLILLCMRVLCTIRAKLLASAGSVGRLGERGHFLHQFCALIGGTTEAAVRITRSLRDSHE